MSPLVYPFNISSSIQEKTPEPAFPADISSASLLRGSQPAAGGVLASEVAQSLEACKLTDANLTVAEDPQGAGAGHQAERTQTSSLENVNASSTNRCSVLIVSPNQDNSLVKAVLWKKLKEQGLECH